MAEVGRWRRYAPGQFLYHAGDQSDGLHGLASGGLQITFPLLAEEPVVLYRAEIGFWVGDIAELSATPRQVSIMAARESRLLHIPSGAIRKLLEEQPRHWKSFYRLNAINMLRTLTVLSEVLALTVRARVCRQLLYLSSSGLEVQLTQEELAQMLGVTRPTLRRCLIDLEQLGGLTTHYGKIRIISRSVLKSHQDEQ